MQPTRLAFVRLSAAILFKGSSTDAVVLELSSAIQEKFCRGLPGYTGTQAAKTDAVSAGALHPMMPTYVTLARRPYSTLARRTSLMAQFQRVKAQFPDHLLLFQVGDFYELYGGDASKNGWDKILIDCPPLVNGNLMWPNSHHSLSTRKGGRWAIYRPTKSHALGVSLMHFSSISRSHARVQQKRRHLTHFILSREICNQYADGSTTIGERSA